MSEPNETVEISGPNNGRWHFTMIPDWIALCPDLKDGGFRLYCILRSLVSEKQDTPVRVLTHDQIASLMVGKNGKPSTVSTIKALLRNLEDVGLIEHPDGTRMASPTGRGNPNAKLRYRLNDWPDKQRYAGWRNAYDKLDWYTEDWPETRTDVAGDDYAAWLAGEGKTSPPRKARERGEQKATPQAKENTRHRRSFSSQDLPVTSENVSSNKPLQEVPARSSSSSAPVIPDPEPAPTPEKKTKTLEPEDIVIERLADEQCTTDEAVAVVNRIEAQGDNGKPINRIVPWVKGRSIRDLRRDLAQVRRYADAPPPDAVCSEHGLSLASGKCSSCEGDMNTGDFETVRKILERDGADARPDIARRTGAPQSPVGGLYGPNPAPHPRGTHGKPQRLDGAFGHTLTPAEATRAQREGINI